MRETLELLREYADTGSEAAFREVVARYMDLVFSTARRLVHGDAHLAQDITQTVFLHLARNAGKLSRGSMLGGWLHRDTCFVASKVLRSEHRRLAREKEALEMNAQPDHTNANMSELEPLLDEAINLLGRDERVAILLRFFERRDFQTIGAELGTGEDAARMRVNRALDKLQTILKRKGVVLSAAALGAALSSQAVTAAPAGLAGIVAGGVLAQSPGLFSAPLAKLLLMTKLKTGIVSVLTAAALVTTIVVQNRASARQRALAESLRLQGEQIQQLSLDNEKLLAAAQDNQAASNTAELNRLRSEAASLQSKAKQLPELKREGQRLQTARAQTKTPLQAMEDSMAKGSYAKNWMLALRLYSMEHNGNYPPDFQTALPFLPSEAGAETNISTAEFELVYHGTHEAMNKPSDTIVIREKEPWAGRDGKLMKVYGFGDGAAQLHGEPNGDFETYEQKHIVK